MTINSTQTQAEVFVHAAYAAKDAANSDKNVQLFAPELPDGAKYVGNDIYFSDGSMATENSRGMFFGKDGEWC
jgi:hypothetical protein